jgi:hypothetical protein
MVTAAHIQGLWQYSHVSRDINSHQVRALALILRPLVLVLFSTQYAVPELKPDAPVNRAALKGVRSDLGEVFV